MRRPSRGPMLVAWDHRDAFGGEDEPTVRFDWPWPSERATAVDALGGTPPVEVGDGRVGLPLSHTPVFISAG